LRRELCSAERFSDAAIFFGSVSLKTPRLRSSASLSLVTRCDQRFGVRDLVDALDFFAGAARLAERLAVLRVVFRRAVFRRSVITNSRLFQPKTAANKFCSFAVLAASRSAGEP
jgi:hypothetical protein